MRSDAAREADARFYEKNKPRVREEKRVSMKKRRVTHKAQIAAQSRKAKAKLKSALFDIYGHECVRCSFVDKRALTLDHKLNNGAEERKALGARGPYYRARDNYLPDEYQILCMNCQFIKRVEDKRQNQHQPGGEA